MKNLALYQKHLEQVSRSFAFCIPVLNLKLRYEVSMAYLLFRVADTIEDSQWPSRESQQQAFTQFQNFLESPFSPAELITFQKSFPANVPVSELALIQDLPILLNDLKSLPEQSRQSLKQNLTSMINGMRHYSDPDNARLKNMTELNRYCFFVAGVVGELLTELAFKKKLSMSTDETLLLKSHHFGLFLQKINILKDQKKDETEGRFFVSDRQLIWQSLKINSDFAFAYICELPAELRDYKLFCAYSFFLGLFSLAYIEKSWINKIAEKMPRAVTATFLAQVEAKIDDVGSLKELYLKYKNDLPLEVESDKNMKRAELPSWFSESYPGQLSAAHIMSLQI